MTGYVGAAGDRTRRQFANELPGIPADRLCGIARRYAAMVDNQGTPPGELRKKFGSMKDQVAALLAALESIDPDLEDAIIEIGARAALCAALLQYQSALNASERYLPEPKEGRPGGGAFAWLVNSLADLLREHDIEVDEKDGGPLSRAVGIAVEATGQHRTVRSSISNVLKKRA